MQVYACWFRSAAFLRVITKPHVRSTDESEGAPVLNAPKADVKIDVCILSAPECDIVVSARTFGSAFTGWRGVTHIIVFVMDGTSRAKYGIRPPGILTQVNVAIRGLEGRARTSVPILPKRAGAGVDVRCATLSEAN